MLPAGDTHFPVLYSWEKAEKHKALYTCRPPHEPPPGLEEYVKRQKEKIETKERLVFVLVSRQNPTMPLGKVTLFDHNSRNHSAEFGYYLPPEQRGKGLGSLMTALFLARVFQQPELSLNKLYATTAGNNLPSMHMLERLGFHLDGRMREHYWIEDARYDQLCYSILQREWLAWKIKNEVKKV